MTNSALSIDVTHWMKKGTSKNHGENLSGFQSTVLRNRRTSILPTCTTAFFYKTVFAFEYAADHWTIVNTMDGMWNPMEQSRISLWFRREAVQIPSNL